MTKHGVYPPSEDTYLLLKAVKFRASHSRPKLGVEIGTGSGIIAIELARVCRYAVATDINPRAVVVAKERAARAGLSDRLDFVVADLLTPFKRGFRADLLAFNPPYVPEEGAIGELAWHGGPNGRETIDRFLNQLGSANVRECLLVQSSLSDIELTVRRLRDLGFSVRISQETKLFFEKLVVIDAIRHYS